MVSRNVGHDNAGPQRLLQSRHDHLNRELNVSSGPAQSPLLKPPSASPSPSATSVSPASSPLPESPSASPSPSATMPKPASPDQNTTASPSPSPLSPPGFNTTSKSNHNDHHDHRVSILAGSIGGGVSLLILIIGIYLCKTNKVATVKPWATGLSGQLQKAFLTGKS